MSGLSSTAPLKRSSLLSYGALALPLAFAGMPLYIHAPDFYATQMGFSLASMGFILLALRVIDAVQDPLIGRLSDRYHRQRGRIIALSAIVLVVSFLALFNPQTNGESAAIIWFCVCIFLATTAFSVISINLNTLGGLWSKEASQKTRITSAREAFGLIGLLLAVILPAMLMQSMPAPDAFMRIAALLGILMLAAFLLFSFWQRHYAAHLEHRSTSPSQSIWQVIRTLPRSTKSFLMIYAVSLIASSIPALLVLFFIRDRLDAEAYTGLFLALYFLSGVAGMPLWNWLSRRRGKAFAWKMSMLLAVVSFVWAYDLQAGDIVQYALICVLSGIAFGADLSLPPAILADHIQHSGSEADATVQFSLLAFLTKAALALASAIVLPLLGGAGFVPASDNSAQALAALSIAYAAIPCAIKCLAIGLLWRATPLINQGDNYENHRHLNRSTHHA